MTLWRPFSDTRSPEYAVKLFARFAPCVRGVRVGQRFCPIPRFGECRNDTNTPFEDEFSTKQIGRRPCNGATASGKGIAHLHGGDTYGEDHPMNRDQHTYRDIMQRRRRRLHRASTRRSPSPCVSLHPGVLFGAGLALTRCTSTTKP